MSIVVEHVYHSYTGENLLPQTAIEDISLSIEPGEFFCIAGHTGSGKTTFIQHLNGLLLPEKGSVTVDGLSTADKKQRKAIRALVGMVFQYPEYQLFAETVREDIAFGPGNMGLDSQQIQRRVERAMELVGLPVNRFAERSPFELSGGEKRRAALAGILAMEPKYIVLDEPMAGLDPQGRKEILSLLERLRKEQGCGIIMVSHSMEDVSAYAQRILVLEKGRICALDKPEKVFSQAVDFDRLGLSLPQSKQLAAYLQQRGKQVPESIYTLEQMKSYLLEVLS